MAQFDWRRLIGLRGPDNSPGSTGLGSDFPESAGERERGKFRPSEYPRLTTVAVSNDDGTPIGVPSLQTALEANTHELRQLRLALTMSGVAADLGDLD